MGITRDRSGLIDPGTRMPRAVAIVGGVGFIALGVWAMVDPRSFFEAIATFEPYNQHFVQDLGAFQIALGVVLLLAGVPGRADGLTVALVGVGVGAALHTVSHIVGRDTFTCRERHSMALSGIGETVEVVVGKHPYEHPYRIAPCVPQRLMERKSRQVGTVDADFPRIRYAVPSLI